MLLTKTCSCSRLYSKCKCKLLSENDLTHSETMTLYATFSWAVNTNKTFNNGIYTWVFFTLLCSNPLNCTTTMVFCYQNFSDLLWEKIALVIENNFWNSRLKAANLQKIWAIYLQKIWAIYSNSERSEQFLVTESFFNLFLEVSHV